jgi:hypothetical protein
LHWCRRRTSDGEIHDVYSPSFISKSEVLFPTKEVST